MKHIQVVAAIIVYGKTEVLCMRRGESRYAYLTGKYEFPGGKMEPGEAMSQALMRELREEMDLDITIREEDFFMTIHHRYPDFDITMHSFVCPVSDKTFTLKEHTDHRWLRPEALGTLDWADADWPIVERIQEEAEGGRGNWT